MRMVRFALLALVFTTPLLANVEISYFTPPEIAVRSGEQYLKVGLTSFSSTMDVVVHFSGPGGTYHLAPSSKWSSSVDVWIPQGVVNTAGNYSVWVTVTPPGGTPGDSMPKTFLVRDDGHDAIDLRLPGPIMKEATGPTGAVVNYVVMAFYESRSLPVTCTKESGTTFPIATTNVTCTTNNGFVSKSGQFTVTVADTTPPALNIPSGVTVGTATDSQIVTYTAYAVDVVDGTLPATCHPAAGSTFPVGTTLVRCQAVDSRSNSSYGEFRVTVVRSSYDPVITVPADFSVQAADESGKVVTYSASARSGEPENSRTLPVSCTPPPGAKFPVGQTTVTCTATDPQYNTSATKTFKVTVTPPPNPNPPVLHLPPDITAEATGPGGAVVTYTVTATGYGGDDHNGRPLHAADVTCAPPSGSPFGLGTTTVTCNARDPLNNTSTYGTFKIHVVDTTPPVLSLPRDFTVQATSSAGAVVTYSATAHDLVAGSTHVSCHPESGSTFPVGTTTVNCATTDFRNNMADGSFRVTVSQQPPNQNPPVLHLPPDITAEAAGPNGAVVTYTVTATGYGGDDHNGRPMTGSEVVCTPASGSTFPLGQTTVTCTATDSMNGKSTTGTFKVTVVDTTPPLLSLPANITAEATSSAGAAVTFSATASDLVDGNVGVACAPASGSTFALGNTIVNCSASDSRNNAASGSFGINIVDTTAPVLSLPNDIHVETANDDGATVTYNATANDAVDGSVGVSCAPPSGSLFPVGTTTVHCSAADSRNNAASGPFNVVVTKTTPSDTTPPVIVSVTASPAELRPANHKLVDVVITVEATDDTDTNPYSRIFAVTANEPIDAPGSGHTDFDYQLTGELTLQLRAERSGQGQDRVYRVFVETYDDAGNRATSSVTVRVPRDGNDSTTAPPQPTPSKRRSAKK